MAKIFSLMTPLLFVLTAYAGQDAANGRVAARRAIAVLTSAPIQINGLLNENVWQSSTLGAGRGVAAKAQYTLRF
jgi:hypothetical protein